MLRLYNYWRSSASTRVRAALNLKGLPYAYHAVALRAGEQTAPDYLARNPAGLVPALERDDGRVLTQSLAILEWLDETHPEPPLLPADPDGRARVRALAATIACEVHPLNNLRVLRYLKHELGADDSALAAWSRQWVVTSFDALERALAAPETGTFCHGDAPGLADCFLFAQVFNNRRFGVETAVWPTAARIFAALETVPAFADAAPDRQPDADG